ncbi:predicted protein [Histoplasma capsulatum var. duboisii H88]|uniref:Predicted protein n=1 Tax=Ajellomyces capsulatus (strain H88) TaxID=544711 RepID=F0UES5_AJEC8|nr:predicted protein [Histoplasma capsulatum var. duboisii H88]
MPSYQRRPPIIHTSKPPYTDIFVGSLKAQYSYVLGSTRPVRQAWAWSIKDVDARERYQPGGYHTICIGNTFSGRYVCMEICSWEANFRIIPEYHFASIPAGDALPCITSTS